MKGYVNIKKLLTILLSIILIFSLVACSNNDNMSTDSDISITEQNSTNTEENKETTDESETTENTTVTNPSASSDVTETNSEKDNVSSDANNDDKTERPIVKEETVSKDDTAFDTYETFLTNVVNSQSFSLTEEPSNLSALNSSCDCNIKFSGDLENGSVTVRIGKENHSHSWGTSSSTSQSQSKKQTQSSGVSIGNSISSSQGQIIKVCEECGFIKGTNFIFVKLPNKSHGHGWSWPNKTPENDKKPSQEKEPDNEIVKKCKCNYTFKGNYDEGNLTVIISGQKHSHNWKTTTSKTTTTTPSKKPLDNSLSEGIGQTPELNGSSNTANNKKADGISSSVSVGMVGVPPCSTCGFRRYDNIYGDKIITFRCQANKNDWHTINFTTFNKMGETVNCECGMYATGNEKNGSFSFAKGVDTHSGTSSNSVSQGWGEVHGSSSSIGGVSKIYKCDECKWKDVDNGFIIKCPLTGKYHVFNY